MNVYQSNDNQFRSINFVLDAFSSDIFDSITLVVRPVVGAVDYLRSMHRLHQVRKELDQIVKLDYESREMLMDALTDIVSINIYKEDFKDIEKQIEDKMSELEEFDQSFKKLQSFASKLDSHQRSEISMLSLRKLNGKIFSIRDEIKSKIWDKNEDTKQLLVLDQMFFLVQELIKKTLKKVDDVDLWSRLCVSLLRIEAFHRGKISFEDFQDDVSELSLFNAKEYSISGNYNAVFEVIEAGF